MRRLRFSVGSLNRAASKPGHALSENAPLPPVLRSGYQCPMVTRGCLASLILLILVLMGFTSAALAQPANDNFANATVITGPSGSAGGNNVGATLEPGEPSLTGNPGGQSAWFVWTAPSDMSVSFNTIGSDFDTLLGVFTGNSVDALALIQDNDNAGSGLQSRVSFAATAGTTYYISVDGYNAGGGASQGTILLN